MNLLQGFVFLTSKSEVDIDNLSQNLSQKFWDAMPGFTVSLMRFAVILIPTIMLVLGVIGLVCPPKEANWLIGYRTRRTVASEEAWFFAQRLRGIVWSIAGLALLIPSAILRGLMKDATLDYISRMVITYAGIQVAVLLLSLLAMWIVMLVFFDRRGKRRR